MNFLFAANSSLYSPVSAKTVPIELEYRISPATGFGELPVFQLNSASGVCVHGSKIGSFIGPVDSTAVKLH